MTARTPYGYPVIDKLANAQVIAAGARERIASAPCMCRECLIARNLPSVQRILAAYKPMDRSAS